MPPGVGLLQALGPDLQKQLLTDNASYANRWFALQEKQLDNAHQADERAKGREHSKWWFYAIFLGVFVLIAIAGIVALYIAGKDVTAEKLLWSLFSLASGVALGWGAKTRSLSHGGGETSS